MKKLSQAEVDDFILGKGLVEIEPQDPAEGKRILDFLKKQGAFIATPAGNFKITPDKADLLKGAGFKFSEIKG